MAGEGVADFALIARGDRGGIASQSWELYRHLHPCRVLLIDLGDKGRGPTDPRLYEHAPDLRVTTGPPDKADAAWLCRPGIRSVFTVEGLSSEPMRAALEHSGTRTILQANPELYRPADLAGVDVEVVLPTGWEIDRFPHGTRILPVPVNTTALTPVEHGPRRYGETRLLHIAGVAMADRNGTRDVIAAARLLQEPVILAVANRPDLPTRKLARSTLLRVPETPTYDTQWQTLQPDVLVLPRRYGGLCLPMQEAAACGVPIVTTAVEPQMRWVPAAGLVPVKQAPAKVSMKGGAFSVHSVDPNLLAATVAEFVRDPGLRRQAGRQARAYAESISWERLAPTYLDLLCS